MSLHRYTWALVGLTFLLLILGSLVHATASSLACPDWPLCYGQVFPEMTGGVLVEHSHRLLASLVGLGTIGLLIYGWRRPEVRRLAWVALAVVLVQGGLGGLTVIFGLPTMASTAHLATAMVFFALLIAIALRARAVPPVQCGTSPRWALVAGIAVYVQMLVGALVRHTEAGLACGTDPVLCDAAAGASAGAAHLQMTHRGLGVIVALVVIALGARLWRERGALRGLGAGMIVAVLAQVAIGVLSVTSSLGPTWVSAHTGGAAALFGIVFASWLVLRAASRARGAAAMPAAAGAADASRPQPRPELHPEAA